MYKIIIFSLIIIFYITFCESKINLKIGDKALRRRGSDRVPEWVEFKVNETYFQLIAEFPEDYRLIDKEVQKNEIVVWIGGDKALVVKSDGAHYDNMVLESYILKDKSKYHKAVLELINVVHKLSQTGETALERYRQNITYKK